MNLDNVNFKEGIIEDLPITSGWADAVISNGVINLCADKRTALSEILRILKPGGYLQFADSKPIPQAVIENIDLWTA
jgi:ubiquinone/menaquinone biosynthesis C-methylase UbiE